MNYLRIRLGGRNIKFDSQTIPYLKPVRGNGSKEDFDYNQRFFMMANQPLIANLVLDYKIDDEIPVWQKELQMTQSSYQFELVGKYVGAMGPVDQVIIPLSYKERVFAEFQRQLPNSIFKLTEIHGFYDFKNKQFQKEFDAMESIDFTFQSPINSFNQHFHGFEYLTFALVVAIGIITLLLILASIKKVLVNNSKLLAMMQCLGAKKSDIFGISVFTILPIFGVSIVVSCIISLFFKYFVFEILNKQGLFYYFYGELNKLDWIPDIDTFMQLSIKDFQLIGSFMFTLLILIIIGVFLTVQKIKIIESLKE